MRIELVAFQPFEYQKHLFFRSALYDALADSLH
jgi:hypothetical protein